MTQVHWLIRRAGKARMHWSNVAMSLPSFCRAKSILVRALAATLLLAIPAAASPTSQDVTAPVVVRSGAQISISSKVDPALVQAVQRELSAPDGGSIDTLVIESTSGDVDSMIQLGRIVHARKMTVRVKSLCAALCAALLAPAAERLVVPKGSFLIFTPLISSATPDHWKRTGAQPQDGTAPSAATLTAVAKVIRHVVERQNAYFKELNVDPDRVYAATDTISVMKAALAAAGKSDKPLMMPDAAYLHKCLGIASVDMPDFTVSDSKMLAHIGKTPIAFLIDGELYYEGVKVATFQPPCLTD